jgi:hypothetical protein
MDADLLVPTVKLLSCIGGPGRARVTCAPTVRPRRRQYGPGPQTVSVVPDFLANACGGLVSYSSRYRPTRPTRPDEPQVRERLAGRMRRLDRRPSCGMAPR